MSINNSTKGQDKIVPDRAMGEYRGRTEVQIHLFLSSALNIHG